MTALLVKSQGLLGLIDFFVDRSGKCGLTRSVRKRTQNNVYLWFVKPEYKFHNQVGLHPLIGSESCYSIIHILSYSNQYDQLSLKYLLGATKLRWVLKKCLLFWKRFFIPRSNIMSAGGWMSCQDIF